MQPKCRTASTPKVKLWDEKAAVNDYILEVSQPAVLVVPGGFTEK